MNPIQPSLVTTNSKAPPTRSEAKPGLQQSTSVASTPTVEAAKGLAIAQDITKGAQVPANTTTSLPTSHSTSAITAPTTTSQSTSQPAINNHASLQQLVNTLKTYPSLTAKVTSSQMLSHTEQQLLQKSNPDAAKQLLKSTISTAPLPHAQTQSNRHAQGQPTPVYLTKLSIIESNSNTSSQAVATEVTKGNTRSVLSLTTLTNTPLKVGTPLQLQLQSTSPQSTSAPNILIKPSANTLQPVIADSLRIALPQQLSANPPSSSALLTTISLVQQLSQSIAPTAKHTLLPADVNTSLERLRHHTPSAASLNTPQAVKSALANSGLFLENKLQTQQSINNDLRVLLSTLQTVLNKASLDTHSAHITSAQAATASISPLAFDALLQPLLHTLHTHHGKPESQPPPLASLLQLFGIKTVPGEANDITNMSSRKHQQLREAIAKHLGQMTQQTQEKIHLNQLKAFTGDGAVDAGNRPNVFNTEIPLRWGEQILPLHISIQEQTKDRHSKESQENAKKQGPQSTQRRWTVFLSFDLPQVTQAGSTANSAHTDSLFAQLTVIDDSVSATVWSESALLCRKAKQQLHRLRDSFIANGLQVDDISCINGKPPPQELSLGYHLVDITT